MSTDLSDLNTKYLLRHLNGFNAISEYNLHIYRQLRQLELVMPQYQDIEEIETWKLTWYLPLPLGPSKKLLNRQPIS